LEFAKKIGYPVIIKAAGGGGGRGMRTVHNDVSLVNSFLHAQSEAAGSFKSSELYIEKYIENAHHVEVQIVADKYGNIVHLGERDCSIQRRFQKLLEEAPSTVVTPVLRRELGNAAIAFARAAKYTSVGTVEFLLDDRGKFYFIEMNARIQVEHPVTEMVCGIDLVKEQIKIAAGERLGLMQKDIGFNGAAMECRINAEDSQNGFRPCPGRITNYVPPGGPGVRVDSHVYSGYEIPPYYDSMIAKIIVHRPSRQEAILAMRNVLSEFVIEGVKTTVPLHHFILNHPQFVQGRYNTNFLDSNFGRS
jgi:acetyl-CoA carboxylase biotin carboxylase subunit